MCAGFSDDFSTLALDRWRPAQIIAQRAGEGGDGGLDARDVAGEVYGALDMDWAMLVGQVRDSVMVDDKAA